MSLRKPQDEIRVQAKAYLVNLTQSIVLARFSDTNIKAKVAA
ncbi:hypothetical protein QWZ16_21045 [Vibrio ostreicida]|uniref:Uncharacterized protein n=1 Tax=Vibrio ostreicida TaxID=526588 RepID=A0ABT8C163_9VIBR|nr:hypothetical protein [Vibrio ostreicida]MDN3612083.1 hypothetical protein [Vibrio ostreicida]